MNGIDIPTVIVTDRNRALFRGLETVFPSVPTLLCSWHINKNILTKARSYMPKVVDTQRSTETSIITKDSDTCSAFMAAWYHRLTHEIPLMDLHDRLRSLHNMKAYRSAVEASVLSHLARKL